MNIVCSLFNLLVIPVPQKKKENKCILLHKRNQWENATYYVIPILLHSGKDKNIEIVKRLGSAKDPRGGGRDEWI